ncbi:MAG: hypothetical protein U0R49_02895 [Fimbriimonadales bacterium]
MKFCAVFAAFLAAALPGWSATYRVKAEHGLGKLRVTVTLNEGDSSSEFRMPAWAPGDYRILDFGKGVSAELFKTGDGTITRSTHSNVNSWQVSTPANTVEYLVADSGGAGLFSDFFRLTKDEFCFDGPAVLGYFVGHQNEPHTLIIEKTIAGAGVECALEPVATDNKNEARYKAPDYDTLVDCPVVHSVRLRVQEFTVLGKPHKIVAFNRSSGVNVDSFAKVCEKIIPQAAAMMGGLPYPRYYFMFDFGGGGGGLEHLLCNKIGIGPDFTATMLSDFIAHEYFHAWNVKRIRAKPLGPFDYQAKAVTGTLWWLEGVTDYYSKLLVHRAGLWNRAELLDALSTSVYELTTVSARNSVSADECSRRVWEAGNSEGFGGMSYYLKGEVVGFCLDMAIRAESDGKHSLDDVMRTLHKECSDGKPGYSETRIRELCIQFGGDGLAEVYDSCVMKPGEVPIGTWLRRLGMRWTNEGIAISQDASPAAKRIGSQWPN